MARRVLSEIYAPTSGLEYRIPDTMKDVRMASNILNCRLSNGEVTKDWGYAQWGSNQPLLGTPCLLSVYKEFDGDLRPMCFTTKYIYDYETASDRWNIVGPVNAVIDDCEDAWAAEADVTCDTSTDEVRGSKSSEITIAAAFGTGLAASEALDSADVSTHTYLHYWIKSDVATAAGDLQLGLSEDAAGVEDNTFARYNVPALVADTWTEVETLLSAPDDDNGGTYPDDLNAVISTYLYVVTDNGAQVVLIDDVRTVKRSTGDQNDGWKGCTHNNEYFAVNTDDAIQRRQQSSNFIEMAGASAYTAKDILSYKERLILINTVESATSTPHRVRWTIAGALGYEAADWSGTGSGFVDLVGTPGRNMRGLTLGEDTIIYKEDSIWGMSWIGGTSVFRFGQRVASLGLLADNAVVKYKGVHFFIGNDYNIYIYSGSAEPVSIGDSVFPRISSRINPEAEKRCFLTIDEDYDELLVHIPESTSTQCDTIYRYSFKEKSWSKSERDFIASGIHQEYSAETYGTYGGTYGSAVGTYGDASGKTSVRIVLFADSDGYVYKMTRNSYNVNGAAQTSYFDTIDITLKNQKDEDGQKIVDYRHTLKRITAAIVEAYGNSITIYYSIDGGRNYVLAPDTPTHALNPSEWLLYQSDFDMAVEMIRLRFYNNTINSNFKLRWIGLEALVTAEIHIG